MDLEELEISGRGAAGLDVFGGGKTVAPILDPTGSHLSLVSFICGFKSLINAETTHTHTQGSRDKRKYLLAQHVGRHRPVI